MYLFCAIFSASIRYIGWTQYSNGNCVSQTENILPEERFWISSGRYEMGCARWGYGWSYDHRVMYERALCVSEGIHWPKLHSKYIPRIYKHLEHTLYAVLVIDIPGNRSENILFLLLLFMLSKHFPLKIKFLLTFNASFC